MDVYKNPVKREAVQFTGTNWQEMMLFVGSHKDTGAMWDIVGFNPIGTYLARHQHNRDAAGELWVAANDSWLPIEVGEWVIKDSEGFYPCKESVFAETYTTHPPEVLHYDEDTLMKVGEAVREMVGHNQAISVVNNIQNAGILFRERSPE